VKKQQKIIELPVQDVKPYENNPRHNDGAVAAVVASIKEFGFRQPILVDAKNVIICGHSRLKAALELGFEKVPCIVADDLNPKQVAAYRIADNKISELATWDTEALRLEIEALSCDFDFEAFGFELNFDEDESFAGEGTLPDELQGKDLSPGTLEKHEGDNEVAMERIIICFYPHQREELEAKLGLKIEKVVYKAEEIL